jgi:peptide/nickel transport system substrate-binding protein
MSGGRFVPEALSHEMRDKVGRVDAAHPVVGIRAADTVLRVLVGLLGRDRWRRHSRHRTPIRFLAALGLVAGMLVLAPGASEGAADDEKVTFTLGLKNEVDSFNPFLGFEAPSYEAWALTYDYMVGYSMDDMSPVPALAKSWETSADGLTWTFDIRDGVTWSDDVPFTAADIAYTYTRILTGETEGGLYGSYLTNVDTTTAPDDTTVVLKLKKPNAALPLLPIPIIPEHIWKDVDKKEIATYPAEPSAGKPVVGTGPFVLVEGKAGGSTYRFEKNPNYWGGEPHIDEVIIRVFKAEDPMVQALIKGEVDFVHDISAVQIKALEGRDGITALNGVSPYLEELGFNTGAVDPKTNKPLGDGNPALKDPKFRHALGYAIDQDRLLESAYQGAAKRGDTIVPVAYPDFRWEPSESEAFKFDLDRAGAMLDEAGYEKGGDGLRTMPDGKPIGTLRLFSRPEEKHSTTIMDFFSEWLGELGIKSEVIVRESNRLTNNILDGEYDIFHWGWYVEADPGSILDVFTCGQRGNSSDSWWCDPEYDALMVAQASEMDKAKRVVAIREMQKMVFEESPYLVLAYTSDGQAYRNDRFACFVPQPKPDGVLVMQYGAGNYTLMRPTKDAGDCDGVARAAGANSASAASSSSDDNGSNVVLIGGAVLLVLVAVGGGVMTLRRRATSGERE